MTEHSGTDAMRADTATMRRFDGEVSGLAARLHEAAERTRHGDPGVLAGLFGPIGVPVLAALTATHEAHVRDLDRLGRRFAAMGSAAGASASAYERSAAETASRLDTASEQP